VVVRLVRDAQQHPHPVVGAPGIGVRGPAAGEHEVPVGGGVGHPEAVRGAPVGVEHESEQATLTGGVDAEAQVEPRRPA
jgi:hypothetical protein